MTIAVITGAGSGIGAETAARLAGAGYTVALCGRRADRLERTRQGLPGTAHSVHPGDLTDVTAVRRVAAQITGTHDGVDVLVHAAGGLAHVESVDDDGDGLSAVAADLGASFAANVLSTALLTHALGPSLRDGRGRVIAVSSIAGQRGGGLGYASAKAAVHGWAYDRARAVGPRGITVNVVAPGYTAGTEFFGDAMTPARHERLVAETLTKRAGRPGDVAATIEFLASAEAGHLTAQVIGVNGGALPG
ncbi:SDR family oxidoreductase [Occultella glacieicola]|uniref:SDR family oxidoreductase n=1 Tax=Occultella glacieicola TaxID=2518684 RepID=A0ABY2E6F1_9MICO|nr:SDR family oxidoreductase [Occultella glacieicola]TDE95772.1 SDR family oxidoreductase [Occultella glacieicola]